MTPRLLKLLVPLLLLIGCFPAGGQSRELLNTQATQLDTGAKRAAFREAIRGLNVVDVRDYTGVVGDGSNDDTAGIQLAANAAIAARRPLYFGPVSVRYKLTTEILISGSIPGIFGTGMHPTSKSVIRQSVDDKGAFIVRHGGAGSHSYTRFYDLRIEGTSNVDTAKADTKGIWFDSETIGAGPAVSFFDENDVERCYISGFTWGIHAEKFSNSNLKHVVCEYVYNGIEIAGDNNNTLLLQNCFAGYVTNIAWRFNGTNTQLPHDRLRGRWPGRERREGCGGDVRQAEPGRRELRRLLRTACSGFQDAPRRRHAHLGQLDGRFIQPLRSGVLDPPCWGHHHVGPVGPLLLPATMAPSKSSPARRAKSRSPR